MFPLTPGNFRDDETLDGEKAHRNISKNYLSIKRAFVGPENGGFPGAWIFIIQWGCFSADQPFREEFMFL